MSDPWMHEPDECFVSQPDMEPATGSVIPGRQMRTPKCSLFTTTVTSLAIIVVLIVNGVRNCEIGIVLYLVMSVLLRIGAVCAFAYRRHMLVRRGIASPPIFPITRLLLWFAGFVGAQVFMFGAPYCEDGNPGLYKMALALIVLDYLSLCIVPCLILVICVLRRMTRIVEESESPGTMLTAVFSVLHAFDSSGVFEDVGEAAVPPLTRSELAGISTRKAVHSDILEACSICCENYQLDENLRVLVCRHVFHAECVDQWLTSRSAVCPMCRRVQAPEVSPESKV